MNILNYFWIDPDKFPFRKCWVFFSDLYPQPETSKPVGLPFLSASWCMVEDLQRFLNDTLGAQSTLFQKFLCGICVLLDPLAKSP